MVGAGLRALLLRGEGVGELEGGALGCAEHPVCGDRMELSVRVQGGRVQAVRWRASGCPACVGPTGEVGVYAKAAAEQVLAHLLAEPAPERGPPWRGPEAPVGVRHLAMRQLPILRMLRHHQLSICWRTSTGISAPHGSGHKK